MSETNVPYSSGPGSPGVGTAQGTGDGGGAASGVKQRASEAASHAGDAGREVAQDAKEKARDVAHEATDRARGLVDQTRTELSDQARTQQERLASGLRSLGDELRQMADGTEDPGYATDLVRRAGDATGQVAQWFEDREPASVLHEVEDFARRRPGTFLLLAAGAGLLVGRLVRGMKDAPDTGSDREQSGGTGSTPSATRGAHAAPLGTTTGTGTTTGATTGTTGTVGGTGTTGTTGVPGTTGGTGTTGAPDIGTAGAYPGLANDRLAHDPDVATSAEGAPPAPSYPPTTPGSGARPGGGPDVVHP
ncbi:hypothetical protein [Cellulosimicrobium aquatile]|uniref:hypothetical protein n=1 Tax=Cellulosimicrobium aquatile TaxID=1612203 RepID=UPI0014592176|nr:hypothetical protein [Cellulosimicrobium aquatile]NMF28994.1 hypothetical protein [Cellulosimicrobium aquatile]